jgi:hypothetical protein
MTIKDLIEELKELPQENSVNFALDGEAGGCHLSEIAISQHTVCFGMETDKSTKPTVEMWVARDDDDDTLYAFQSRPINEQGVWAVPTHDDLTALPEGMLPQVDYNHSPRRIKITLEDD